MQDLIDRQSALDALEEAKDYGYPAAVNALKKIPPVQPDADAIHLQKEQAYMQGWEDGRSAMIGGTCDTCVYGHFGDAQCDNCRVRYPSHYERRTDERPNR